MQQVRELLVKRLSSSFGPSLGGKNLQWSIQGESWRQSPVHVVLAAGEKQQSILWIFDCERSTGMHLIPIEIAGDADIDGAIQLIRRITGMEGN